MIFCLKYLPNLPDDKLADVPDHPDTKKFLLWPESSASMLLLSGAASLNRQRATVFSLTGNSPVKSVCDVKIDLIATSSPPSAFSHNLQLRKSCSRH